jgi:hypothetical protein
VMFFFCSRGWQHCPFCAGFLRSRAWQHWSH